MEITDEQFRELLNRYLNGTATPAERKVLDKFFESYESQPTADDLSSEQDSMRHVMLREIHSRVGLTRTSRTRSMPLWLPIAATIAFFLLAYVLLTVKGDTPMPSAEQAVIVHDSTTSGQRITKTLPDGTTVHLNSNTRISYPQTFGSVREISLTGEAYFEVVANGKPFIVHSGNVKTQVLGTSFNVKNRPGSNIEVTLAEGKVNVESPFNRSLTLQPGEQAVVNFAALQTTKRNVNALRYSGWKDNMLFFEQTPFEDAIRGIEEWYAVKIDIASPSVRRCLITAKYANEPLQNVLSSLQFLLSLEIKQPSEAHFIVQGKGCQ